MNIVIIILLVWLIAFMHIVWFDWNPFREKTDVRQVAGSEQEAARSADFIGESQVQVSRKKPVEAISVPQAAIGEEGEEVHINEVTFADENAPRAYRQMTPEEEEEAFKSFNYSKAELEEDDYPAEGYSTGVTSEEMEKAIEVAKGGNASKVETLKAGKVLKELDGTELYELLTKRNEPFRAKVRELIDRCENAEMETSMNDASAAKGRKSFVKEKTTDIDLRDFI